jgi:hypothetical protein
MKLTLYGKSAKNLAKVLGIIAGAALLGCIAWTLSGDASNASADCRSRLSTLLTATPTPDDQAGNLRITGRWPQQTVRTSGRLCLVVAGVAKKNGNDEADAKRPRVEMSLFLDDRLVPLASKPTAAAKAEPQLLTFEFNHSDSATADPSKSWRSLLAGRATDGMAAFTVGVARAPATVPDGFGTEPPLKVLVYRQDILALGAVAMALLIAVFVIFAANSTVLRDNTLTMQHSAKFAAVTAAAAAAKTASDAAPGDLALKRKSDAAAAELKWMTDNPDLPVGAFSLGRTQMALWLGLTIAGFIFLWLTLGFYLDVITSSILVLLGINGATGLASVAIDKPSPGTVAPQTETRSFLGDLVCDPAGSAQLHRIQMAAWTCILAVIFLWNTIWNFNFVNFDTNLLLLMGIANALYLGFKPSEKP